MDRRAFLAAGAAAVLWRPLHTLASAAVDPRLRELQRDVRGPVLVPADPGYETARRVYNRRLDGAKPMAVVRPRDARDVQAAVRWGRKHDVRVIPRSGGHSYGGYSTGGGVVVDMSTLRGVQVQQGAAVIRPGARMYDVYATLSQRGLTVPAGSCPTVGFGGLALGGGIGLASRKLGTTSDNVLSMVVVTGDGNLRTCNAKTNADLFWALRGGGGRNFGIVTSFRVKTTRATSGSWFVATYPWSAAPEIVPAWQRWAHAADPNLTTICSLGSAQTLQVFGQYFGPEAKLRSALPAFVRNTPMLRIGASSYFDLMLRWAGCLGDSPAECRAFNPTTFAAKSDYVRRPMPVAAVQRLQSWLERRSGGSGALLMDSYGGRLRRGGGAFPHRDVICSMQYLAYWPNGTAAAPSLQWLRGFHGAMRPYVTGGAYVNYVDPDLVRYRRAYYGRNSERLVRIRRKYDPDRVFRFPQAI